MDLDLRQRRLSHIILAVPGTLIFFFLPLFLGAAT